MKLLSFTDHHGSLRAEQRILALAVAQKPDLLVCAGDISFFGTSARVILHRLNALAAKAGAKLVLIPGNHEDGQPLMKWMRASKLRNIIYLHKRLWRKNNCLFMGWGSGGFAYRDSSFVRWANATIKKARIDDKVILLLHGPPHGTRLDMVVSGHCGNKDYTAFIKKHQPDLVLCGHIHEGFGKVQKIGKTVLLNPGPFGAVVELKEK
ncbi:metallophosphoesterase family protein [Candidatus Woesearchaeota archaeon]|nr:metallophosphoesterase family protein [Candidatus Woesearchaeota archaeon]